MSEYESFKTERTKQKRDEEKVSKEFILEEILDPLKLKRMFADFDR